MFSFTFNNLEGDQILLIYLANFFEIEVHR